MRQINPFSIMLAFFLLFQSCEKGEAGRPETDITAESAPKIVSALATPSELAGLEQRVSETPARKQLS